MATKSNKPGFFISFEGGEGAGKTTLMKKIQHELIKRGHDVIATREPGGSKLGETIREWLLNQNGHKISAKAELMLFLAARAQHLEELIKPALSAGKIVLCDRFNDSTVAYQGAGRALGFDEVQRLCDFVCSDQLPDLTFFLDVDPEEGLRRTRKVHKENARMGEVDRIESERIEFHQRVREALRLLAQKYSNRICVIDANKSQEDVFETVLALLLTKHYVSQH